MSQHRALSVKRKLDQQSFAKSHSTTFTELVLLKAGRKDAGLSYMSRKDLVSFS